MDNDHENTKIPTKTNETLVQQVGVKAERKLKARRHSSAGVWFGLGMMGLIGWSISVPTLLGAALGLWLDKYYTAQRSWTLALLLAGLTIGCFTAWSWVNKEHQAMRHTNEDLNEDDKEEKK
ncbi:MAG: ATP synthase protein I [Paraglaciecola sp.]|jgi:ATP synthase protein I